MAVNGCDGRRAALIQAGDRLARENAHLPAQWIRARVKTLVKVGTLITDIVSQAAEKVKPGFLAVLALEVKWCLIWQQLNL